MNRSAALVFIISVTMSAPAAFAQTVDMSEWACEFCPFDEGQRADFEFGASSVSDDSAYFGDATGYDESGVYANVDGHGGYDSEKHRLRWTLEDLGLDSRFAELEGGRPGMFDYQLAYREMPRRQFDTTTTIFQQPAGDTLSLPSAWVRAPATSGLTALNSNLVGRNIESDRNILQIGGRYLPTRRFSVSADYRRQEQDGLKMYGGSSFTNASILPMPFDYATDEVDFGVRYSGDNSFVSLGWYLSDFENSNAALNWEQPFTTAPGAESVALAQAPDSRLQQLSLAAGYTFPQYQTVISASAAIGNIEQDAAFLDYTTNSNLTAPALSRATLDGDIDTSNFAIAITSKPFDKARVKFSYRFDERDNKTAQAQWERVIVDTFLSNDPEQNIPYSFERSLLSISGDYDLFDNLRVSAGYDRREIDRDFQEVPEQTEDTGWGQARWRPLQTLDIDVRGGTSKRDIDTYNEGIAATFDQNPLMRKYNLAYRYRQFGELKVTWSPATVPMSITLDALYADDDYTKSQLGITNGDELNVAADFSWSVSTDASIYVNVGIDQIDSEQTGSESFAAPDWRARHEDDFTTVGAGFRLQQIADKFDLQLDYTRSDGETMIDVASGGAGPDTFPDLESELDDLRLRLSYQRSEQLEINLNLRYQRFIAEDWALEGVGPGTIPVVLSLGAQPYSPERFVIGIGARYQFGSNSVTQ